MNLCELRNVALERKARDYTYRLRIESLAIRAGEENRADRPFGLREKHRAGPARHDTAPKRGGKVPVQRTGRYAGRCGGTLAARGAGTYGPAAAAAYRLCAANRRTPALLERAGQHDNAGQSQGMDSEGRGRRIEGTGRTPRHRAPAQRPAGQTVHRGTAAGRHSAGAAAET